MRLQKAKTNDLVLIKNILLQWTDQEEVDKYLVRIEDEINGKTEFNTHFWTITNPDTVGILGISDPLPKISQFFTTTKPVELKILYLDNSIRGQGLGRLALIEIEKIIINLGYQEIFARSASRYQQTAWGFYQKMGYQKIGLVDNDMAVFHKKLITTTNKS